MSILKYKYKAHKFINNIFYVIVFLIGFGIGFGAKEINFSKLISQFLMIDNVSATTIYDNGSTYIDESFIYNYFVNNFEDFDFNEYGQIVCATSNTGSIKARCYAFPNSILENGYINKYYGSSINIVSKIESFYYYFAYNSSQNTISKGKYNFNSNSNNMIPTRISDVTTDNITYSNFDFSILKSNTDKFGYSIQYGGTDNSQLKKTFSNILPLDFSSYLIPDMVYNENLFKDNPDFKEVCVPNNKDFAISSNQFEINENENSEYYGSKSFSSYGFVWFPYYVNRMESYLYDNSKTDNIWIPEEDETYFELHPIQHYWLDSFDEINRVWDLDDPGNTLESLGYTDKYSYFGWYTHPFVVRYANSGLRQFSIFRFSDDVEFYSTLENGLDYFEKLENARNGNVCFYIPKDFNVTLLDTDEFGDKYGDIIIMEDEKLEVSTTQNISNIDSKGLFEKVKLFLNKMTKPIDFVKDYIFELYDSMPYLLKLFIISVFGLIVIKILIGMVVR